MENYKEINDFKRYLLNRVKKNENLSAIDKTFVLQCFCNDLPSIVKTIQSGQCSPIDNGGLAFKLAVLGNAHSVVKYLCDNYPVNVSSLENFALTYCAKSNDENGMEILLEHWSANPSLIDNKVLRVACFKKHYNIAKMIINDVRFKMSDGAYAAFESACFNECTDMINFFMTNPNFEMTYTKLEELLFMLASMQYTEALRCLLCFYSCVKQETLVSLQQIACENNDRKAHELISNFLS